MAPSSNTNQARLNGGRFLAELYQKDSVQGAFMQKIITAINKLGSNVGASAIGDVTPPPPISNVNVQTSGEYMQLTLNHNAQVNRGINYFAEIDTNPNFSQPLVKHLGPSRSPEPFQLPTFDASGKNHFYYVRAYAQYQGSKPSKITTFGGPLNPASITMGGSTKMDLLTSTGSGTSSPTGQQGGSGFGRVLNSPVIAGAIQASVGTVSPQSVPIITPPGPGPVTDGLTHGDSTDWWNDAGFAFWRDDFNTGNALSATSAGATGIGELGWSAFAGTGATSSRTNGGFYNPGVLNIIGGTTANQMSSIYWPNGITSPAQQATLPLGDYAGWKMVWVFGFPNRDGSGTTPPYPLAKKQFYCGLSSTVNNTSNGGFSPANGLTARPQYFMGVRFDTDPGKTYALTSVANHSGSTTTYTGSGLSLTSPELIGVNITIAGFSNSANNGVFQVVAVTGTTITVLSAVGVAESASATAVTPAISDTTMKFEVINNFNFPINTRNNIQGTVVDTAITPVEGAYYRLEMLCTEVGSVTMTLTGGLRGSGVTFTTTMTFVQTFGFLGGAGGNGTLQRIAGGFGFLSGSNTTSFNPTSVGNSAFLGTNGTVITISSAPSGYNGTFTITDIGNDVFRFSGTTGVSSGDAGTVTFIPGLLPYCSWGNDSQSTPAQATLGIDFFSLVWSPGLGGASLVNTNPRYW